MYVYRGIACKYKYSLYSVEHRSHGTSEGQVIYQHAECVIQDRPYEKCRALYSHVGCKYTHTRRALHSSPPVLFNFSVFLGVDVARRI